MIDLVNLLKKEILRELQPHLPIDAADLTLTIPPQREFGNFSSNISFLLARKLKQNPREIAFQLKNLLQGRLELVEEIAVAGNGFLNFFLKAEKLPFFLAQKVDRACSKKRAIVEHTSINPNKAAHIGHLRNSILGDTLSRILNFLGYEVEVQNYIDDTGIQMADVIYGLLYYKKFSFEEIQKIDNLADFLWDLYPEISSILEKDPQADAARREVHKKIESNINPEYEVSCYVAHKVLLDHIKLMEQLGIRYDLVIHESDVLKKSFFAEVAELLRQKKILYLSQSPERNNCEVILYRKENIEKVVVRSNKTITYIGKDIAYHFWKFGLISRDFDYKPLYRYPDGKEILSSTSTGNETDFSHLPADIIFNLIDVRQSYLQNIIAQVIGDCGFQEKSAGYIHFSYEMVALSAEALLELGFRLTEEEMRRNFLEVSGRKGQAIKGSTLLEKLISSSFKEVQKRHPELSGPDALNIARQIAVAALRYFMLKFSLKTVIVFDFKEALNFEGDSGPYLQYTLVRIKSILRKLQSDEENISPMKAEALQQMSIEEKNMICDICSYLGSTVRQLELVLENREPALFAEHCFKLCQKFNNYYHSFSVINAQSDELRSLRLNFIKLVYQYLKKSLELMGIPIPEIM